MSTNPPDPAFVGTWVTEDEISDAAYRIAIDKGKYLVSAFCITDGEEFEISAVDWDGKALCIAARMPSTNWKTRSVLRIRADGKLDQELTFHEVLKQKEV